jgi:hypothetical protein
VFYVGIFLALLVSFSYYTLSSVYINEERRLENQHGNINNATRGFVAQPGDYKSAGGYTDASSVYLKDRDADIETALIRTCRAVSTKAHSNNCASWNSASAVWSFVGTAGTVGSLDSVWTNSTSNSLASDCSNIDAYGRYIFTQSVHPEYGQGKGYKYNLQNLDNTHADPCGYDNIITR